MNCPESNTPKRKMLVVTTTYVHHLTQSFGWWNGFWPGVTSTMRSLANTIKMNKRMNFSNTQKFMSCSVNILPITWKASPTLGIRKNIHRKLMSRKLMRMLIPLLILCLTLCSVFLLSLVKLSIFSITWKNPWRTPQSMKVQLAPCQMPLMRKVIMMLR